jgi:hypothetical protein
VVVELFVIGQMASLRIHEHTPPKSRIFFST